MCYISPSKLVDNRDRIDKLWPIDLVIQGLCWDSMLRIPEVQVQVAQMIGCKQKHNKHVDLEISTWEVLFQLQCDMVIHCGDVMFLESGLATSRTFLDRKLCRETGQNAVIHLDSYRLWHPETCGGANWWRRGRWRRALGVLRIASWVVYFDDLGSSFRWWLSNLWDVERLIS